jgi:hypothetical protein
MKLDKFFAQKIIQSSWYPIFLITIGLVSYVISSPSLGFYWDDWQAVFLYQNYNPQLVRDYFFFDRPFSSWTYEVTFPFLPMHPFVWQFFTMFIRVMGIWLSTRAFELIWTDHKSLLRWAAALLLVFPSFSMQSISVAFNQHFLTFLFFSLSIYLMVIGYLNKSRWRWLFLFFSVLFTVTHIFTMEYFIGLEAIRPFLLFFMIRKEFKDDTDSKKVKVTFLYYLPYFIVCLGFLFWRMEIYPQYFVMNPSLENPNSPVFIRSLIESPKQASIELLNLILQDTIYLLTQSWLRTLELASIRVDAAFYLFSTVIGLLLAVFFMIWMNINGSESQIKIKNSYYKNLGMVGSIALLIGGLPVWMTDRQLLVGKWSDRFSLGPMFGVVLLILIGIFWFVQVKKRRNILLVILLGLSIAFQMRTTHSYALDWQRQKEFYWQLYWRAPSVKPGTAFFSSKLPSNYSSSYSIGFFVNTLYGQVKSQSTIPYWYFSNGDEGKHFLELSPDKEISYKFRNLEFIGSTSNAIAYMHKPESGCLLILEEAYLGYPDIDPNHLALLPISNPGQIDSVALPVIPSQDIFGIEPEHDWCFYFQKADLARQNKNWEEVFIVIEQADQLGLTPRSGVEKMPELEALFYTQDWESFIETSKSIFSMNEYLDEFLCIQWDRLETNSQITYPENVKSDLSSIIDCSQPFKQ